MTRTAHFDSSREHEEEDERHGPVGLVAPESQAHIVGGAKTYGDITAAAQDFGKMKLAEAALDKQLKAIKKSLEPLHNKLLAHMEKACINSMKLTMGLTIYLHTQIWAKRPDGVEVEDLAAALKESADTEFLVKETINAQTLSSFVREFPEDESGEKIIPDELKGLLEANEVVQVRARKS